MRHPIPLTALALLGALCLLPVRPQAQDASPDAARLPDWKGQWIRIGPVSFDPSKPRGLGQQAPLTPEFQAVLEKSIADQAAGGTGDDPVAHCTPPGMPRMMVNYGLGMEFVITSETTYLLFGEPVPQVRRIYTDGRAWPAAFVPTFAGYSIGRWEGDDGHGRYAALRVETRGMHGPRVYDGSGAPLHPDGKTVVEERLHLDAARPDILDDDITVLDDALTRPWSIERSYRRERPPVWVESICGEFEPQVRIGAEDYYLTADGLLMPTRKDQPPPDLRNFK